MSNDTLHEKLAAQEDQLRELEADKEGLLELLSEALRWYGANVPSAPGSWVERGRNTLRAEGKQ